MKKKNQPKKQCNKWKKKPFVFPVNVHQSWPLKCLPQSPLVWLTITQIDMHIYLEKEQGGLGGMKNVNLQ